MKYLNMLLLFCVSGLTLQAQSNLKGVVQKDFPELNTGAKYFEVAKKWGFQSQVISSQDDCNKSGVIDLVFLVDATSSMNDQIDFLKAEIKNTIETVQDHNNILFRTGSVFYRDLEEEYMLRSSPFSKEADKTIQFIESQNAAGGGDYPEAFADGFLEAMSLDWNENADAKLLFIFCDAPPHQNPNAVNTMQKAISIASTKGITLFPVIGTAADFDTEAIMKSLAHQSKGALISIQEEKGSESNEADFLIDLVQDLLKDHTDLQDCDPEFETTAKDQSIAIFPNPADEEISISASQQFDAIKILNADGKLVYFQDGLTDNTLKVRLDECPSGIYFVHYIFETQTEIKKLVVSKQ